MSTQGHNPLTEGVASPTVEAVRGESVTVTTKARQEPHAYRIGQDTDPESSERTRLKTWTMGDRAALGRLTKSPEC